MFNLFDLIAKKIPSDVTDAVVIVIEPLDVLTAFLNIVQFYCIFISIYLFLYLFSEIFHWMLDFD